MALRTRGAADRDTPPPVGKDVRVVFCGLLVITFMAMMDQAVVATAGPTIAGELGGLDGYAWVFVAYMLAFGAVMPVYGKVGDLLGRRPVLVFALVTFLLGSAACGLAGSMGALIAFRLVQGLGGGGLAVLAMAIVGELLEPRQRARYQGVFTVVFATASVAGPAVGGLVTEALGWRWVFFLNLPIGAVALLLVVKRLRLPVRAARAVRVDAVGAVLLGCVVTGLVLVTTWGGTRYAWTSPATLGLAGGTVALAAAWLAVERRAVEPLVPLRLFRDSTFALANLIALLSSLALFGVLNFLPLFLQLGSGVTVSRSALLMVPALIGMTGASLGAGQLIYRTGRYKWAPVSSTALGTVALLLLSTCTAQTDALIVAAYLTVLGTAAGLSQQTVTLAAQNTAPRGDFGVVTSTVAFSRNVGALFGNALFGAILTARLAVELPGRNALHHGAPAEPARLTELPQQTLDGLAPAYADALSTVFLCAAPVLASGFGAALLMRNLPLRRATGERQRRPDAEE
ncbi:MDR family MFS transporter [Streptomyces sulphureus]|uniref:MDR family MFS transporter n=1 Tax=Streptomyces sulphureus TaxID=47758 RepID=UPI0003798D3E|nr:MDR family MFS transporter [Streptomyces sulphureus]